MATEYHIIYPRGDLKKLQVLEYETSRFDLDEYKLASRQKFHERDPAVQYALQLARNNGLELESEKGENVFLD